MALAGLNTFARFSTRFVIRTFVLHVNDKFEKSTPLFLGAPGRMLRKRSLIVIHRQMFLLSSTDVAQRTRNRT